VKKKHGMT